MLANVPMAVVYGLAVALLKGHWWPLSREMATTWLLYVVGVVVGTLLLYLDRVVYTLSYPKEQLSQQFAWLVKERRYREALSLLDNRRGEQNKLTFRSALFMVAWVPLAFFALTSTSGLFGKGVVMGLMFHILVDSWRLQRADSTRLNERLFWQVGRVVRPEEQLVFMYVLSGVFVLLSLWVS